MSIILANKEIPVILLLKKKKKKKKKILQTLAQRNVSCNNNYTGKKLMLTK